MMRDYFWVPLRTLLYREWVRIVRIWSQTLLPSPLTMTLYLLIFGHTLGPQIDPINGSSYISFILPGLILMGAMNNAYSNVASSFFSAKFVGNIEEMLVSSMSPWALILGFVSGGVARGLVVSGLALMVASVMAHTPMVHPGLMFVVLLLTTILFSAAGLLNGLYARKFDDVSFVPTFILTPLIYLGGVFYAVDMLPPFWQQVALWNPVLHLIQGFRVAMLGWEMPHWGSFLGVVLLCILVVLASIRFLLARGRGVLS